MVNIEPGSYKEAMASSAATEWMRAMEEEMKSHHENQTWDLIPRPPYSRVLGNRWLYKLKRHPDGSVARYKARLVVQGFRQIFGTDYLETYASVGRYESVRLLLAVAAAKGLHLLQFDVKTAFLHGQLDGSTLYMDQPEGFSTGEAGVVCRLNKSIYGLKQSPRCWLETFTRFMRGIGLIPTQSDP